MTDNLLNLNSTKTLTRYLDLLISSMINDANSSLTTSNDYDSSLSAGAIAGIVISVCVVVISSVVVVILVLLIFFYNHFNHKQYVVSELILLSDTLSYVQCCVNDTAFP